MQDNIFRINLADMLAFDRKDFEKTMSLVVKKEKTKAVNKWEQVLIANATRDVNGSTKKIAKYNILQAGKTPVITQEESFISGYSDDSAPVMDLPIIVFGDHSCTVKYIDFPFFRGADGTVLLKPRDEFIPKYFYFALKYFILKSILNSNNYERHIKYLKNMFISLPPKDVQEKIVAEIEGVERQEDETIKQIDTLKTKITQIIARTNGILHKLSDILTLEYGSALPAGERVKGEFPVMGSNGIVGYHNEFLIEGPSIIVGRKGSAGKITWVAENSYPIDTTFYVNLVDKQNNLKLIYYLIGQLNLEQLSGGSGVPGLNRNDVYNATIKLPSLVEQNKTVPQIEKLETKIHDLQKQLAETAKQKESVLKKHL
jgi:restriction endonuclease S subunit